ncbi:MAG: hypothetical protein ACRD3J_18380, partial [Thermoanaerobaculia bacterium]
MATFDSSVAGPFVQLNGSFRLSFNAKGAGGNNGLAVFLARGAPANLVFVNQTMSLTSAWNTHTFDFAATESGISRGTVQLVFTAVNPSAVIFDDVSVTQLNGDPTNTTAFRDPVVNALKTFNPGILRYWVEDLGDSLDNEIAPPLARMRANYSSRILLREDIMYGLHEFLELCDLIHAEPWFVVPTTFTNQEMTELLEYLGGPVSTTYGAKRASRGRSAPWTDTFSTIHLELGNEAWNMADCYGSKIADPTSYGRRGSELFGLAKGSPYYSAARFDMVLGGQASLPARKPRFTTPMPITTPWRL